MSEVRSDPALFTLFVAGTIAWISGGYLLYRARVLAQPDHPLGSPLPRKDLESGWRLRESRPGAGKRLHRWGLVAWFLGGAMHVVYWAMR